MHLDSIDEAINVLEQENRIDVHLSPGDNAARILESVLLLEINESIRAAMIYAINVLKSDVSQTTLPVGLTFNDAGQIFSTSNFESNFEDDYVIRDWLMLNYTPKKSTFVGKKRTNKTTYPNPFRKAVSPKRPLVLPVAKHGTTYLYDEDSVELSGISAALEGVDEWEWDVFKLKDASHGRPLQTLGWHLIHRWDLISNLGLDSGKVVLIPWQTMDRLLQNAC